MGLLLKKSILFILALWSILLCGGEVSFIITADLHGDLAAFARLAPQIRRYPQAVKIDLGDFAQSSFPVVRQNGFPVIEAFNELSYDILVPGNHDLEFPIAVMQSWHEYFRGKIMGAQWFLGDFRMPGSVVVERSGLRIGIIALGETGLSKRAPFWAELHYADEAAAVAAEMRNLRRENCHAIILIAHISTSNYPVFSRILNDFPEIDAVIGAHSHREMPGGIMSRVLFCQPGSHAESAVLLKLHFDDKKRLRFASSVLLRPEAEGDAAVLAIAQRAESSVTADGNTVLARFRDVASFGRIGAEIIRRAAGADAAIIAFDPAKFRENMSIRQFYELFPYGNRISVVTVRGDAAGNLLRRRRRHTRYFGAGDFSGREIRLAVNDYILTSVDFLHGFPAEIFNEIERDVILEALKNGEYSENIP
ncbi:MAG: hypothetical protein E7053_05820 [Lentisphaerae bacterium]|nr:hypothetical protein [Lentisphaerota bacterium]